VQRFEVRYDGRALLFGVVSLGTEEQSAHVGCFFASLPPAALGKLAN